MRLADTHLIRRAFVALLLAFAITGITACGNSGVQASNSPASSAPTTSSTPTTSAGPTLAEIQSWPAKWCSVQPGVTPEELIAVMGTPTDDFRSSSQNPGMSWAAREYMFNAFIGVDGQIRQMDINDIQMTASEKAALTCNTTRVVS